MAVSDFPRDNALGAAPHRPDGALALPLVLLFGLAVGAAAYISYVLWPRWPGPAIEPDAPALPITVAGVAFNVPPAAVRMPVQRHTGEHERIDLAFLWPSLAPPKPAARTPGSPPVGAGAIERLFVTIAAAGDALPPAERVKTIYSRYIATDPIPGPNGLAVRAFRDGTPYQGEDLIYDAATLGGFLVRCSRNGAGHTPGTCLYSRRIDRADIVVRFPRDRLNEWRALGDGIERLIASLRPRGG